MVGDAIPELVVLASVREQAEQARGSKPVSSTPPCPCISSCFQVLILFEFLSCLPSVMNSNLEVQAK